MKTSSFSFKLPDELIAQNPPLKRGDSRLLVLNKGSGRLYDTNIKDICSYLKPGSLMIFNNTRVRKARFFAESETGGKVEFLFLNNLSNGLWEVITSKSKKQKKGKQYKFPGELTGTIENTIGDYKILRLTPEPDEAYFEEYGHIPLPPYIKRMDTEYDSERYQTVYSEITGSSAAPTAGLHFTDEILDSIRKNNIDIVKITLHVGLGTFIPIRTENIEDHKMHKESYYISEDAALKIEKALKEKREITAVGTTVVRSIESAYVNGRLKTGWNNTDIFIYPGFRFNVITNMFTNFHTPNSTLLLMVSAFAGTDNIKNAYNFAVSQKYRFFSYGDAMLIKD
jgi:S-adenosylmethionine:tRNA ribosyltransferase-isomerase